MDTGYIQLTELTEKLNAAQEASFRMVLQDKEGKWLLHTLIVDIVPEELLPNLPTYCYDYGLVTFIAGIIPGTNITSWLMNKKGKIDSYDFQYDIQVDVTQQNIYWTRHPSNASIVYAGPKIAFPFTLYNLPQPTTTWGLPSGILVNDHCPFFPSVQSAIAQLMYEVTDPNQLGATNQGYFIRFIHDEASIKHINISPLLLSIEIDGTNLAGTRCQISGPPELTFEAEISHPQRVDCPLPQGMPPEVWIVLSRGSEWLDHAYISQRWSPFRGRQGNVSFEVTFSPPDILTQIQEMIAQGEGPNIEFKRHISDDGGMAIKTVAAFANGEGGVILLGVDDKINEIVGITESLSRTKDSVTDLIRRKVVPEPLIRFEHGVFGGKTVVAVFIEKGNFPPYGINPEKPEFYVRRGASTFPAKHEEIVALAQPKLPGIGYPL
jgi:hypothetical protein